jgi:hypothetical protein
MTPRRHIVMGIAACTAFAASGWTIMWLIKSSQHPDRPPLYAIAAFLFAIGAAAAGLVLTIRTATGLMRASRDV